MFAALTEKLRRMTAPNRLALDGGRPQLATEPDLAAWPQFTSDDDLAALRAARRADIRRRHGRRLGNASTVDASRRASRPRRLPCRRLRRISEPRSSNGPGRRSPAGQRRRRLRIRRCRRPAPDRRPRPGRRGRDHRPRRRTARPSDGLDGRGTRLRSMWTRKHSTSTPTPSRLRWATEDPRRCSPSTGSERRPTTGPFRPNCRRRRHRACIEDGSSSLGATFDRRPVGALGATSVCVLRHHGARVWPSAPGPSTQPTTRLRAPTLGGYCWSMIRCAAT